MRVLPFAVYEAVLGYESNTMRVRVQSEPTQEKIWRSQMAPKSR